MLLECNHCGAPLDIQAGATFARCTYCGRTQRVKAMRTQAVQTPQGWNPPPRWTPPPNFRAPTLPLTHDPSKTVNKIVMVVAVVIVATTVLPIGCFAFLMLGVTTSSPSHTSSSDDDDVSVTLPSPKAAGPIPKICKQAAACCRVATPQNTRHCDNMGKLSMKDECQQIFDAMKRAAEASGKRCD